MSEVTQGGLAFLHDGTPVMVVREGSGVPGEYQGSGPQARWIENPDYVPAVVARLVPEEVEQGQLVASMDDTAAVAREQAIADGTHSDAADAQFVHEPQAAPVNGPAVAEPAPALGEGSPEEETAEWQAAAEQAGWTRPVDVTAADATVAAEDAAARSTASGPPASGEQPPPPAAPAV